MAVSIYNLFLKQDISSSSRGLFSFSTGEISIKITASQSEIIQIYSNLTSASVAAKAAATARQENT